jgi:hypothetical protein
MSSRKLRSSLRVGAAALLLALIVASFTASRGVAQDRTEEGASVRFVHASPDAPAVDIVVDGAALAEGVNFGDASDYLPLPSGKHQVEVVPSGESAGSAVLDEEIDLDGGSAYLFAVAGPLNDLQAKLYEVNLDDLDENQARVRLINLAPDQESVDLSVAGGDQWQSDVAFPDAGDYKDVDAATYDLEVRAHDGDTAIATLTGVEAQAARAYDILLLGSGTELTALTLETRVAPSCGNVLGVGDDTVACVRVTNASPDSSGLDIYINDSLVIQNLAFGASTEFASIPSGDGSSVKVTATGGSLDSPMVEDDVDLDAGQAYELITANTADDLEVVTKDVDLSPVPAGQARIRVIGASKDAPGFDVEITDGPKLFGGVGFKDDSDNAVVDASTYDLQFKDGDDVLARVEDLQVEANMYYDLIAVGSTDDGTFQIIALTAPTAAIAGGAATPGATPEMGESEITESTTPEVVSTPTQ